MKFIQIIILLFVVGCSSHEWKVKEIIIGDKNEKILFLKSTNSSAYLILANQTVMKEIPDMKIGDPILILPQNEDLYQYKFNSEILKKAKDDSSKLPEPISSYERDNYIYKECSKPLISLKSDINWPRAFQLACFKVVNKNWDKCNYLIGKYDKIDSRGTLFTGWNGDSEWRILGPVRPLLKNEENIFSFLFEGTKFIVRVPIDQHVGAYTDKLVLTFIDKTCHLKVYKFNNVQEFSPRLDSTKSDKIITGSWIDQKNDISEEGSATYRAYCPENHNFAIELRRYRKNIYDTDTPFLYQLVLYADEKAARLSYFSPSLPFDSWKREVDFINKSKSLTSDDKNFILSYLGSEYKNQPVGGTLINLNIIYKDGHSDNFKWQFLRTPNDFIDPYTKAFGDPFSDLYIRVKLLDLSVDQEKKDFKLSGFPEMESNKYSGYLLSNLAEINATVAFANGDIKKINIALPKGATELLNKELLK